MTSSRSEQKLIKSSQRTAGASLQLVSAEGKEGFRFATHALQKRASKSYICNKNMTSLRSVKSLITLL